MNESGFNSRITDGTAQGQREPLAFRPDYFNADEMSFEMLLSMASEYAATFNYYNAANQKEGSWAELFSANEAVIMALIATCDVEKIEAEFTRVDLSDLWMPAEYVIEVAATIDFWLQRLTTAAESETATLLRSNIYDLIRSKLLPGLHTAADVARRSAGGSSGGAGVTGLSPVWQVTDDEGRGTFPLAVTVKLEDHDAVVLQLEMALLKMTGAIRYLKSLVTDMLQRSLQGQSHEPAIGLFMVFLRLYEVVQQRLNRFTERHLDFYYRDCLKTVPRGRQAESLFLKFAPAAATRPFVVGQDVAFSAGKPHSSGARHYYLKTPLLVRRATVSALRTLYLQRNPLISPECELGHVTRIKSHQRRLPLTDSAPSMPLFGAAKSGIKQSESSADTAVGFSVASSILALKEGRREVELVVDFALPDARSIDEAFSDAREIDSAAAFRAWFGEIFSHYLLRGEAFLTEARRSRVTELIATYGDDGEDYTALLQQSWQDLFYKLFRKPFAITLSGESGWLAVKEYLVSPAVEDDSGVNSGLRILFSLGYNVEPVVPYDVALHGGNRACNLPMMNVCLDPEAGFFSYSLLNSLTVNRVEIAVSVTGVKDLVISNHLGRVDPTKPFVPFGPLPVRSSYIVVGSREAASKQVTEMQLALEWGELPAVSGGFSTHYEGYEMVPLNSEFEADISVLQDGHWVPSSAEAQYRVALFKSGDDGVVCEKNLLNVAAADYLKPLDGADVDERYEYRSSTRNGFVRLQLSSPENAFGHADYPLLLTRVLSENSRRKRPLAVPNAPYTPTVRQISMNYRARSQIQPGVDASLNSEQLDDALFHLHPFGIEQLYPAATKNRIRLFPQFNDDGNLFIGVETEELSGTLTLFFDLDEDTSHLSMPHRAVLRWSCLTASGWSALEDSRVLSDTTEGFLMSGVVTLNLPAGMIKESSLMPQGQYWIQVSSSGDLQGFCGLRSVETNVGQITHGNLEEGADSIVADEGWRAARTVPGLAAVSRIGPAFGGRAAESERAYRTRISERLRHKGRASTAWDYERLTLERFPAIHKVKCFPNTSSHREGVSPGNILIVVVPHMQRDARDNCNQGMVNSAELERIRKYLQGLASPFVQVEVRNPVYERIQVRCSVKFAGEINAGGLYINRLNRAIGDYICPWCDVGYTARFGWVIRGDEIESYIRELDYVDFITNFSMLHIAEEGADQFLLTDSATLDSRHEALIRPCYPWSLAVPMSSHFIETTTTVEPIRAQVTGVNELEIGSTFIIGGN